MHEPRNPWIPVAWTALCALAGAQETERLTSEQGFELNGDSASPSISSDGRWVAITTEAANADPSDTNGEYDVYVVDRATGAVQLVSRAGARAGDSYSFAPSLSASGRRVAFTSHASDLVPNDTNAAGDVFVANLDSGAITRVSVATGGTQANGRSEDPHLSASGRYVVFASFADNLVPGDVNGAKDIFLHDRGTGTTEIVSVSTGGSQINGDSWGPSVSADGRYVVFNSLASNAVLGDANGGADVFRRDRWAGTTVRVSEDGGVELDGASDAARMSEDGRYVVFRTLATNLAFSDTNDELDVYLADHQAGTLTLISYDKDAPASTAAKGAVFCSLSRSGRYVTFTTDSNDIVDGDTNGDWDVFLWDRTTGARVRASVAQDGSESAGLCLFSAVSDDGQVAFQSSASDLVPGDSGLYEDVFVRNPGPEFPTLYCTGKPNSQGCVPFLSFAGTASTTATEPFSIVGLDFLPGQPGFLFYGVNGKSNVDFHGGKLCVKLPFLRWLPFKQAAAKGGSPCAGRLSRNFNARIQGGADPRLTAGQVVHAQWLQRDPADPAGFGDGLSNGIGFTIGP